MITSVILILLPSVASSARLSGLCNKTIEVVRKEKGQKGNLDKWGNKKL